MYFHNCRVCIFFPSLLVITLDYGQFWSLNWQEKWGNFSLGVLVAGLIKRRAKILGLSKFSEPERGILVKITLKMELHSILASNQFYINQRDLYFWNPTKNSSSSPFVYTICTTMKSTRWNIAKGFCLSVLPIKKTGFSLPLWLSMMAEHQFQIC